MTQPPPLLHLDWIQLHVKWLSKFDACYARFYEVKKLSITTRHFNCVEEVFLNGQRIATVTSKPKSNILDPDSLIVKFDNWVCYAVNMRKIISEFLSLNGFQFISFSRVDFCADFNLFDNGMLPDKFIKKYIYRKLLRLGKSKNIAHNFEQGKHEHIEKGLKFGSNLSEVTAYIYDKTREMETIKWKPWIYLSWVKGGLDVTKHVWRVEFSMKSGAKLTANTETGEIDLFLSLDLIQESYIHKCFFKLYERYFTFVWNDGQVRRDRMRKIKLFKYQPSPEILINAESLKDADRSKKIFIKKLHELNAELRGTDILMNMAIDQFKNTIIEQSHLQGWAMYKGLNT